MTVQLASVVRRYAPAAVASAAVVPLCFLLLAPGSHLHGQKPFLRGDANADGRVSVSDALALRRSLLNGGPGFDCLDAADADDSGAVELLDALAVLNHIHLGGAPLPPPFPEPDLDPTADELGCPDYQVAPAQASEDMVALGSCVARIGEIVEVPVYLTNAVDVEAFQLVVRYDPLAFDPMAGDGRVSFEGAYLGGVVAPGTPHHNAVRVLRDVADDHLFVVGVIPNLLATGSEVPPGEHRHVFSLVGRVLPHARPGDASVLLPTNGPEGRGVGSARLLNEISSRGGARYVATLPRTMAGILEIVGDVTIFRGDANRDGQVGIADAVFTLDYLFLGGVAPRCFDEADADDDGSLSIVDPIAILTTLFLGGSGIAPPYPSVGVDPTEDDFPPCPPSPSPPR